MVYYITTFYPAASGRGKKNIIKAHLLSLFIITFLLQLVKDFPDILYSSWNSGMQHIIYVSLSYYYANSMPIQAWDRSKNERPRYTATLLILFLWFLVKWKDIYPSIV